VTLLYRVVAELFPPRDRASLLLVLHAAIRAGVVSRDLGEYLKAALDLPELRLRNAMVPRVDVIAVPDDCPTADVAKRMAEHGRKRLPVYHGTIDAPLGLVHAVDVANALANGESNRKAGDLVRPAPMVPDMLPLLDAIYVMRSEAAHVVLVVDERGGFAGLATLEDVLEQLLGPIPDEYADEGRDAIRVIDNGVAVVGAAAGLHEIERMLHVRFPRGEFASIGGLVYDRLRRVPRAGDSIELPGVRIEVLSMDGVRLRELRVINKAVSREEPRFELRIGREVMCGADLLGRLERVVLNPLSGRVSHIVVRHNDRPAVVPLSYVEREDDGVIYLQPSGCDVERFPTYEMAQISDRTEVVGLDGPIGRVRNLLTNKTSGVVTHIVVRMSSGLLPPREVVVPIALARTITPERIELAATRAELLELPEFRPDEEIGVDVLRRLHEDPRFQGIDQYTIQVEVDGGVVRLLGRVRTTELKRAAEELAAQTRGVLAVENKLIADNELAARIEQELRASGVHTDDIEVAVLLGQVRLRGQAATPAERDIADRIARAVAGVESVKNDLAVHPLEVPG
jgi:Mg2+/Co2+ transporter CorC/osmotically-inducible protein OsmY